MAKAAYIVTDMDLNPEFNGAENVEFATEAKALKAAKEKLKTGCEDEVWVWRLSHIISRPDTEPDVEQVI
jgi:hypothetical protein